MKNSSRFFANRECEYYPCHEGQEEFNCMFCYCPFYPEEKCPGNPEWIDDSGSIIKNCTNCTFPHRPESYDVIVKWIVRQNKNRQVSEEIRKKAVKIRKNRLSDAEHDF